MRPLTMIPKEKAKGFIHKPVKELSGSYSVNKIDMVESLNRKISGWAHFYQFTDYTATIYSKLDRIIFWKQGHWLAKKYKTTLKNLIRQWVRSKGKGTAKTWTLFGRNGMGRQCGVSIERLVSRRKCQFRWRNPSMNPYVQKTDESRNVYESFYAEVAFALSNV